jgi:hypothetical protein
VAEVEIYTPVGVLAGTTSDALDGETHEMTVPLTVSDARWYPLDGSGASHRGTVLVDPDDLLLLVAPQDAVKVHMTWYPIAVELGPYRLTGQLATHPGFDPARAIARPGGTLIAISDVTIELNGLATGGASTTRPHVLVNRYAVDLVSSPLMLGHFFPGARLVPEHATAAAG